MFPSSSKPVRGFKGFVEPFVEMTQVVQMLRTALCTVVSRLRTERSGVRCLEGAINDLVL